MYRLFVIAFSLFVCIAVWYILERTRVGMVVRAATEKADLTRALGINVDRWVTPVFGFGVALAALGGVLASPMRSISPEMGADLIIVTFAVVVIGGLGSILGSVATGAIFIVVVLAFRRGLWVTLQNLPQFIQRVNTSLRQRAPRGLERKPAMPEKGKS